MNIWTDCERIPITKLLTTIVDNRGKTVPTADSGHILIATNCVTNNTLFPTYEKVRYLSEETYQTFFRGHPLPGDILFVNKGTPGRVCMVPDPIDFCIAQDMISLRANNEKIYNKYLFSVLRSDVIQKQIYNTNVGDVIPHFKKQFMDRLEIPVPPRRIQEKIGNLYYDLSYKIEHNNKINAKLEEMAQALFKSWFIDFEPFKVGRDGSRPAFGSGNFVESELGMIPEGWKVGNLSDIAIINPSLSLKKGQEATYLDMSAMPTSGSFPKEWIKKEYAGGMKFQNGDTLMARITPCLENGKVAYVNFLQDGEIAFGSTEYIVIRPKNGILPEVFYFLCRYPDFVGYATKNMNGSSGRQRVSGETIGNYQIVIPNLENIRPLIPIFKNIMEMIRNNGFENKNLAQTRDTLLPKLMSGEIEL